ncbi:NAD(P)-dependent oxidoreductase [Lacticaseibacillus brantae]|uniref:Glyoxylate reductase n=1 Tax=Lacticaseibacillus brantae DSM 23927 TaxID=1423727 RepID=A0A0R2AVI2_9LACO|nr:NAD(P)-dependent oxidoreductase [Lacticaseibacillus brantae]KRM71441.1 glyoxylate reductase [Lacticaseibacillus brantae DSM 23927]
MARVFISDKIPAVAADQLQQAGLDVVAYAGDGLIDHDELKRQVASADFLISTLSTTVDADIIESAPHLKLIANFGAGFNNIDIATASAHKIPVTNTPAVSTNSVAEVTMGLMLAASHRIVEGDQLMRTEGFDGWQPLFFLGHELRDKTLGIVGLGNIGQAVAKLADAFGMHVNYTQRHQLTPDQEQALNVHFATLDEIVADSDFISLHIPLTADNKHMFNATTFKRMKRTAWLINAARGPIVDEAALVTALQQGDIAGAALDVYEHEPEVEVGLKPLKNVILTPHIGNATVEARDQMAKIVAGNVIKVLQGEKIVAVN